MLDIDKSKNIVLMDNIFLLNQIQETLNKIGAEKYFSDPSQETQKARESFAEFFFMSAIKKELNKNLWLIHPNDIFPDFYLVSIDESSTLFEVEGFELVEIPAHCQSFDDANKIVESKLNKGYPENYNLLIYINHEKSIDWERMLTQKIENHYPFKEIWIIHLLFKSQNEIDSSVVSKIRPLPLREIKVSFNEKELYQKQYLPKIMEKHITRYGTRVQLKQDFMNKTKKTLFKRRQGLN